MASLPAAHQRPLILIEDDPWMRAIPVILDPATPREMVTAFDDFMSTDVPDFQAWCNGLRAKVPNVWPARVKIVETGAQLHAALPEAAAAIVESLPIGETELAIAPRLVCVHKYGALTRGIDTDACAAHGVAVLTIRRRANVACAEHAFALMLALARRITRYANVTSEVLLGARGHTLRAFDRRFTPNGNWARVEGLVSLHGSTIGIIGLGEIGREIARRAQAFEMRILYHQRTRLTAAEESRLGVAYAGLDDLLALSDWVVPQLPASPQTRHLIDADRLARMKRGAAIVNVSRPDVLDRDAVVAALRSGHLGGLGLDPPFASPTPVDDALAAFDNVIVTPHFAGSPRTNGLADFADMIAAIDGQLAAKAA